MNKLAHYLLFIFSFFLLASYTGLAFSQEIVVYSARKEHLIRPVFELYKKETGVKIKYITEHRLATLLFRLNTLKVVILTKVRIQSCHRVK